MELPVDHLKHAMAPGQVVSGIWCNLCSEFAMEVVMGADLDSAIIAPQSCASTRTALACTRRCAGAPISVKNWSSSAATLPGRPIANERLAKSYCN